MAEDHLEHMRDVRDRVMDIQERLDARHLSDHDMLIRLNTLSERIVTDLGDIKDGHVSQMAQIDGRLRALEQARWMMYGASGILGALAGFIVQYIAALVGRH